MSQGGGRSSHTGSCVCQACTWQALHTDTAGPQNGQGVISKAALKSRRACVCPTVRSKEPYLGKWFHKPDFPQRTVWEHHTLGVKATPSPKWLQHIPWRVPKAEKTPSVECSSV